jgi:L-fucose isomerase-like protein
MKIKVLLLKSVLSTGKEYLRECNSYISELSSLIDGDDLETMQVDELEEFKKQPIKLVFISTGGTAATFKKISKQMDGPFFLITRPTYNSLAASMEIMGYMNENNLKGEIIHGSSKNSAKKIEELVKIFSLKSKLNNTIFGVIGYPDLISSEVDSTLLLKKWGASLVTITMEEFFLEVNKETYEENQFTKELKTKKFTPHGDIEKSLYIYGAIKRIVQKYNLNAVTVRCFDLLEPFKNTGCLGLAILNAEGIYAACEADSRSMLSMFILGELTGNPVFMANPSSINSETGEIVLAHCVLPMNMPTSYKLMTHFESGIGVALKGELRNSDYTLFKCWENGDSFVQLGRFIQNMNELNLCRTQVKLKVEDCESYLKNPLANHQMICEGDFVELINHFFEWL